METRLKDYYEIHFIGFKRQVQQTGGPRVARVYRAFYKWATAMPIFVLDEVRALYSQDQPAQHMF